MNYEEMIDLLRSGGIDVDTFDTRSAKSLSDLYKEIEDREITLHIHKDRVTRVALTVKIMIVIGGIEYIRQLKRVYPSGKEVVRKGFASITETRRRGESSYTAVIRGMQEECGIAIDETHIRIPSPETRLYLSENYGIDDPQQEVDEHESTVYEGLITIGHVEYFEVHLPSRPWPEDVRIIDDCGVKIHLEYWRLPTPSVFEAYLRALST